MPKKRMRNLIIVLGDQLNADSDVFSDFDKNTDAVWMAEVTEESAKVWNHKVRIALFLAAMRHFRDQLKSEGIHVLYYQLDDNNTLPSLSKQLSASIKESTPQKLIITEPCEWSVHQALIKTANKHNIDLEIKIDTHFYSTKEAFAKYAENRTSLRMEYFYREMRKTHNVLMAGNKPVNGQWNFDADNRASFGKSGPPDDITAPMSFKPDATTRDVLNLVEHQFHDHPGSLKHFDWPVTTGEARRALAHFIKKALPRFGDYQDALWTNQPYLYHSRLAAAMNLKLLNPREVVNATEQAYKNGTAPINAVEGFIRQILGWREYIRGVYWLYMPEYLEQNFFNPKNDVPHFYWTAKTRCECLKQCIGQTLEYGYAHHIQRLMVTGLFAMLAGIHPKQVHEWYLAVYADAVEWVELPNTLGMSPFGDGGLMASKPYVASGKYIQRMSNYCNHCPYDPAKATGENACPFTTLYWNFLAQHHNKLADNRRMSFQIKNLERKDNSEIKAIQSQAEKLLDKIKNKAMV